MPIAFFIVGSVLIAAGVRSKSSDLWQLVKGDFSGDNNYTRWVVAILIIGVIGYVDTLRPVSRAFLALMMLVLFLSNGGFFAKFNEDFFSATAASSNSSSPGTTVSSNSFFGNLLSQGAQLA